MADPYHLQPLAATTVKPEKGEWVRYGDGWVPKDHPLALEAARQASSQVSTAPTPMPTVGTAVPQTGAKPTPAPAIPGMAGATTSTATLAPEPVPTSSTPRPDTTSTDALQGSRGTIGTAWMSNTPTGGRPRQSLAALKTRAY